MNKEIKVEKNDILKFIYFIAEMSQNSGEKGMYGTLAGKSDLMGGIFDRWINIIPESTIFNKYILPQVSNGKNVEIITDFYKYSPKQETTGIAPDVLGLRIDNVITPFIVFNEKWTPIKDMPQIEVKTFKKPQQMVSLRDQGYAGKYLVMVESNYRVDYLLPFFDNSFFSHSVYEKMIMDDSTFIVSNSKGLISHLEIVDNTRDDLGTLKLLTITESEEFKKVSTNCEPGVSPIRISSIEESSPKKVDNTIHLSDYCTIQSSGLYRFNSDWYDGVENDIPYYSKKSKNGSISKEFVRILDFYCNNLDSITLLKKNKNDFYIHICEDCELNASRLAKGKDYKVSFTELNRAGTDNGEYFLQKELINFVPSKEKELLDQLEKIINKGERK